MVSCNKNYIPCQHAYVAFDIDKLHVNIVMLHGDINDLTGDRSMPPFIHFVISLCMVKAMFVFYSSFIKKV